MLAVALGLAASAARPAAAGGLILSSLPVGYAGPQLDAASLSPQPLQPREVAAGWQTCVVGPGDTLSSIAAHLGTRVAVLQAANALANPDRITAGQVLKVGPDARGGSIPVLPPDGPLTRVQLWPWPPSQGETLAVWLHAAEPMTFSVRLGDATYPVVADGRRAWALVPIPALATPGMQMLTVAAGEQVFRVPLPLQAGTFPSDTIPPSASTPILSQADRVKAEAQRMAGLFAGLTPGGWTPRSRFQLPLAGDFPRTSPFGSRRTYGNGSSPSYHAGEDYSAAPGTPVYAPAPGTVVLAELLFVRGNAVVLDHGHGVYTGYWHLSELDVKAGDRVEAGQRLAAVGSTGLSTGAHLHWELRIGGTAVDPLQWVEP